MGLIASAFDRSSSVVDPKHPRDPALAEWFGGRATASGVSVTVDTALQLSAVYACVRVLAESVAQLPLIVYQRLERGKERALNHPLYSVLHDAPNPEQTSFEFRELSMGHLLLRGNAYAEIERDGATRVRALWPIPPDRVRVERLPGGALVYRVDLLDGGTVSLAADRVLHQRAFSRDGIMGRSVLEVAREAIALGLALQEYGARFFANDARPSVVLTHPGSLKAEAAKNLKDSWDELHRPLDRKHRTALLEEGVKVTTVGVEPEHAQFLESRKFTRSEIAAFFRVPPHKIGDLEKATFSNIEHQAIEFVTDTLMPWLVRSEQCYSRSLFRESERPRFFAQHLVEGLLRGDTKSRFEAYAIGRGWGWLSANDVLELENRNPIDGGDRYLEPLNMRGVGDEPDDGSESGSRPHLNRGDIGRARDSRALAEASVREIFRRVVHFDALRVRAAAKRSTSADELRAALTEHYDGRELREYIDGAIGYLAESLPAVVSCFAARYIDHSRADLMPLVDSPAALEARLLEWEGTRAGRATERELRRIAPGGTA